MEMVKDEEIEQWSRSEWCWQCVHMDLLVGAFAAVLIHVLGGVEWLLRFCFRSDNYIKL